MFNDFLYLLRGYGVPVSTTEWLAFQQSLAADLPGADMNRFYDLARALLVKSEARFDRFDLAFAEHFQGAERPEIKAELLRWLAREVHHERFTEEELERIADMPYEELLELFQERLEEQTEQHDGGSKWIGTGGTSPFGHSGRPNAPSGVRVGGSGGLRRAVKIATRRRFRNFRTDIQLNVRQMTVALRKLRRLGREGRMDEIHVDGTIRKTCDNGGEIELVFQPSRKNSLKLLLISDVGGSMEPFRLLCERLFTAAHKAQHFKRFRSFYFHNCIYDEIYRDAGRRDGVSLRRLLQDTSRDECVIIVGDAAMAPSELFVPGGCIEYWNPNERPGLASLQTLREALPRSIWLNPLPRRIWRHPTVSAISEVFPMYELTLDGLERAVDDLRRTAGQVAR